MTLDPDTEQLIKRAMKDRGLSFKQAVNEAIRAGLAARRQGPRRLLATHDMGEPLIDLTKALQLAGELEDEERIRGLAQAK